MRVDANVSMRPAGTETLGTRCEIKNLNSIRSLGPRHRVRGQAPDRPARSGRAHPAGDPSLERGRGAHAHAPLEGGGGRLPLLPRARSRAARTRRRLDLAARRRAASASRRSPRRPRRRPPVSRRPTGAVAIAVERDLDGLAAAAIDAGGDPAGCSRTSSTTSPSTARPRSHPPRSRSSRAWRSTAR